jgi:hypothetical protein
MMDEVLCEPNAYDTAVVTSGYILIDTPIPNAMKPSETVE